MYSTNARSNKFFILFNCPNKTWHTVLLLITYYVIIHSLFVLPKVACLRATSQRLGAAAAFHCTCCGVMPPLRQTVR